MINFLRDPIWQFIGAILAIVTIIISIYLYYLQKTKKSLAYDVLIDSPLLSTKDGLESRVQILFDNKVVQNVSVFAVKISNDGNVPILAADFAEPLCILFGDNAKILEAEVFECYPTSLKPKIIIQKNNITLEPLLLNSGDSITLKLVLSKEKKSFEANARIVGVSKLSEGSVSNKYLFYTVIGLAIAFIGGGGLIGLLIGLLESYENLTQAGLLEQQFVWVLIGGTISVSVTGIGIAFFYVKKLSGQFTAYASISNKNASNENTSGL